MLGPADIAGVAAGVVVGGIGLWLLTLSRRGVGGDGAHAGSGPTRLTIGVVCLLVGYHAVVWSLPAGWGLLSVPRDRWWLVGLLAVVSVLGALAADVLESRE